MEELTDFEKLKKVFDEIGVEYMLFVEEDEPYADLTIEFDSILTEFNFTKGKLSYVRSEADYGETSNNR